VQNVDSRSIWVIIRGVFIILSIQLFYRFKNFKTKRGDVGAGGVAQVVSAPA
jgi:hypothetical protein